LLNGQGFRDVQANLLSDEDPQQVDSIGEYKEDI
jgi:hypothetical protein